MLVGESLPSWLSNNRIVRPSFLQGAKTLATYAEPLKHYGDCAASDAFVTFCDRQMVSHDLSTRIAILNELSYDSEFAKLSSLQQLLAGTILS